MGEKIIEGGMSQDRLEWEKEIGVLQEKSKQAPLSDVDKSRLQFCKEALANLEAEIDRDYHERKWQHEDKE